MTTTLSGNALVLPRVQLLIGGDWGDATDAKRFPTLNPATEDVIAEVSEASSADVGAAASPAQP